MKPEKLKHIIEQPASLTLDDNTRIDTSLGVAVGLGTTALILTIAIIKNILNCYHHYSQMLVNVETMKTILGELKTDQDINFQSFKTDFERINQSIHELQIWHNSTGHRIEGIQKIIDLHEQKIELLEACTNKILGKLGDL